MPELNEPSEPDDMSMHLARLIGRFQSAADISALTRLTGGASQETWSFQVAQAGSVEPMILRRAPPGTMLRLNVAGFEIEARAIALAAAAGLPVPRIRRLLVPADQLGDGFLCDYVEGETIARRILRDGRYAALRRRLVSRFGEILARLHSVPTGSADGFRVAGVAESLAALRGSLDDYDVVPRPVFEHAFTRLVRGAPSEPAVPAIVHGDFRLGNIVVDAEDVRAVLDWEQVHIGDPAEDLAWLSVPPWRFGSHDRPVAGLGDRQTLIDAYVAAGGAPVTEARVRWWEVVGSLRWGIACSRMAERFRSGEDPSVERAMIARRASESEFDLLVGLAELEPEDA